MRSIHPVVPIFAVRSLAELVFVAPLQTVWVGKDVTSGRYRPHRLKGEEVAVVDQVGGWGIFWGGGGSRR
jgi:hypothetical protein